MRFQASLGLAVAAAVLLCLWPGSAGAGGRLPMLSYRGGGQGKVVFDHQLHASHGFHCNDCHTDFAGTGKQLCCNTQTRAHRDGGPYKRHKVFCLSQWPRRDRRAQERV